MSFRLVAVVLALSVGGCKLIDQRTFESAGQAPDTAALERAKNLPKLPLLTIAFASQAVDFQNDLQAAVLAAQSRKPDADFDVLAPIPTSGTQALQDTYQKAGEANTLAVARGLGYAGVSEDRIHVGFQGDSGVPTQEVRVYVR